jgi:hypothetical protein
MPPDGSNILDRTIRAIVDRELTTKVLDRQGQPALTQHQNLAVLGELAQEMWVQARRNVDQGTFDIVVDIATEGFGLEPGIVDQLMDRLKAHAVLKVLENPLRVAFRHELYFYYFLAGWLADNLKDNDNAIEQLVPRHRGFDGYASPIFSRALSTVNIQRMVAPSALR